MNKLDIEYDLIVIIDCLSDKERTEKKDADELANFLAKNGFEQKIAYCGNKISVFAALMGFLKEAKDGKKFTINFISHGNPSALDLRHTGEWITWHELRPILREINKNMAGGLVVNMSCCWGFYGFKIDEANNVEESFFGVVGPTREIYPIQSIRANEIFYTCVANGMEIPAAVKEINKELGDGMFRCMAAQENKQAT